MAPTTTRTRLTDQEKMKICEEKKKPGFSIEKIMKDYSISQTDDMFCLTRLENKVFKEQLVAKDARKKQKSFDLDEGFGNFLNCTRRKESFETESALEPGIFRTNA